MRNTVPALSQKKFTRAAREEKPIDFAWVYYIGMNKLGFTYRETGQMYIGLWADLFETHKKHYNFETKRGLYDLREEEPISSLSVL